MKAEANQAGKKTIIMLSWEYPPNIVGGLARHVNALSAELAKNGHEVHVITANPAAGKEYEMKDGVHVHRVTPLNHIDPDFLAWIGGLNLAAIEKSAAIAREVTIDVVHTHDWLTGPAAEYIGKALNIPFVATIHGTEYGRNKGLFTKLQHFIGAKEQELVDTADRLIVCSDYMAEEVAGLFAIGREKMAVIPNGADAPPLKKRRVDPVKLYPFLKKRKTIFSIGRIVKEKGYGTVIKAAAILKHTHPDICFIIAGNGPLLAQYRQMVKQLAVDDTVFFIGFIPDEVRLGFLEMSVAAIFPSLYEPFGLAAAEAVSFGIPTIVARTGGMQGLVEDGRSGFYVEPGNAEELARIIAWVVENGEEARLIAHRGKEEILANFSWRQNALMTERVYEELMTVCKR